MNYQILFSGKNNKNISLSSADFAPRVVKVNTSRHSGDIFSKNLNIETRLVCVEVLWPSQPIGVMSSVVSLPNHTFTGQA